MGLSKSVGKLSLLGVVGLMAMIVALAACGGGTVSTASAPKTWGAPPVVLSHQVA